METRTVTAWLHCLYCYIQLIILLWINLQNYTYSLRVYRWKYGLKFQIHGINVKCILVQALRLCTGRTAHRGSTGIALFFLDRGTRRGEGSASLPGRTLPPGKSRYPFYRRLVVPQGRSGQVLKISPPTGFDPRIVQPVASHNKDSLPHTEQYASVCYRNQTVDLV